MWQCCTSIDDFGDGAFEQPFLQKRILQDKVQKTPETQRIGEIQVQAL